MTHAPAEARRLISSMMHDLPEQRANLSAVTGSVWLDEDNEQVEEVIAAGVEEDGRVDEDESVSDPTVAPLLLVEEKDPAKDDDEEEENEEELVILHRAFTYWSPAATPLRGATASGTYDDAECDSPVFEEFSSPTATASRMLKLDDLL